MTSDCGRDWPDSDGVGTADETTCWPLEKPGATGSSETACGLANGEALAVETTAGEAALRGAALWGGELSAERALVF